MGGKQKDNSPSLVFVYGTNQNWAYLLGKNQLLECQKPILCLFDVALRHICVYCMLSFLIFLLFIHGSFRKIPFLNSSDLSYIKSENSFPNACMIKKGRAAVSAEIKLKNPKGMYSYPLNTKKIQVRKYKNEISHIRPQYILLLALFFNPQANNLNSEPHHFQFASFHYLLTSLQDSRFYPSHSHIF